VALLGVLETSLSSCSILKLLKLLPALTLLNPCAQKPKNEARGVWPHLLKISSQPGSIEATVLCQLGLEMPPKKAAAVENETPSRRPHPSTAHRVVKITLQPSTIVLVFAALSISLLLRYSIALWPYSGSFSASVA
jgi:hypothetical protein